MRALLAIVLLAAAAWSGWWWWSASARQAAVENWLAERRAAGWVAEATDVRVSGFPNRVDLTAAGLALADPRAGWMWEAPFFQILAMTWQPHHFVAVWPPEQLVATPYETLRVESARMRGSLVFVPGLALEIDRLTVEATDLTLVGDAGWRAGLGRAVLATRRAGEAAESGAAYDLSLVVAGLALPDAWTEGLDVAALLPTRLEAAEVDATLRFDRPWDRRAVETDNPRLEAVDLRDAHMRWGRLDLRGRGALAADAQGFAEGRIDLRVRNWREALEIALSAGAIGAGVARAAEAGLGLAARLGGGRDSIDVPLVFENGRTYLALPLAPVPVGDAPRLTRR
jgi:hypothetical protein